MSLMQYKTVYQGGTAEIVEKKSRFIAHVAHAETEEEALAYIEEKKKKYWDARHNCSAFVVGTEQETARCSDDGEPAQTAGKPMLEVLQGNDLKNTVVVVTRYFGGVLLGTGGLVRAYTAAVQEGLKNSLIIDKKLCRKILIDTDYTMLGKIQYIAAQMSLMIISTDYTEQVRIELLVPQEMISAFQKKITEVSNGRLEPELGDICYGADVDGETVIFSV